MNYLVTGGAGFIGSHLVDRLLSNGHSVTVIDNLSTGNKENLTLGDKLKFVEADIVSDLDKILGNQQFDAIFHLAALPQVQKSIDDPKSAHLTNIDGTHNLLLFAKDHQIKRFIFTSSCSVYGDQEIMPMTEDMVPHPISPYALHKLMGEQYCQLYSFLYKFETVCLRPFNVYGPRQNPAGSYANMIPKFTKLILGGQPPTIWGTGENTRDYVYVSDVVEANILAAESEKVGQGEVINIGFGQQHSINDVAQKLLKLANSSLIPIHQPSVVEPKATMADTKKAQELLGWSPKVNFEDGLKVTYDYFAKTSS